MKNESVKQKVAIFSAPSGSGKSTIVGHLLKIFDNLEFSISATSRAPRGKEQNGKEYYFITAEEFEQKIKNGDFVEYEEVYENVYYGTLKSEVERIWSAGHIVMFDVDVKGGVHLKQIFGDEALSVFVKAPSIAELRRRLESRGTESVEDIDKRIAKAAEEMEYAPQFDVVLVNDDLEKCLKEAEALPIFGK